MKWAGMFLVGFVIVVGALLAALWKLGVLQHVDKTWIAIGVAILLGIGIMISVTKSGSKENIQIDR
jgi:CBS-domain-containing membrane protein